VNYPRVQPGERLSAGLINRMLDAIERLENMTADASSGIELVRSAGGICLRLPPSPPPPPGLSVAIVLGADTTLAGNIDDAQASITVDSGSGFSPAAFFYVLIGSEILQVTSFGGTAGAVFWSVNRGQFGTTPAPHADGAAVYLATVLDAPCSSVDTTITIDDLNFFPGQPGQLPYYVLVESEVMQVTDGAGSLTLTVNRAQFGTTAVSHPLNAPVTLWVPSATSPLPGVRQAALTTQDPVTLAWTLGGTIFLAPINGVSDPDHTPLFPVERYFALPDGQNGIPYYQAQGLPAKEPVTAVVRVFVNAISSQVYGGVVQSWTGSPLTTTYGYEDSPTQCLVYGANEEPLLPRLYVAQLQGTLVGPSTMTPVFAVTQARQIGILYKVNSPQTIAAGAITPIDFPTKAIDTENVGPSLNFAATVIPQYARYWKIEVLIVAQNQGTEQTQLNIQIRDNLTISVDSTPLLIQAGQIGSVRIFGYADLKSPGLIAPWVQVGKVGDGVPAQVIEPSYIELTPLPFI
jgi:hypothetical protein